MKKLAFLTAALAVIILSTKHTQSINRTVCASGCAYTNAQFQTAINDAAPGDNILLQSGFTYSGSFILRHKGCTGSTPCITIKAGVNSTGGLINEASLFPVAGKRVDLTHSAAMAKILPVGNNEPAIRTVYPAETGNGCAGIPCRGNGYQFQFIEFQSNSWGGGSLVKLGSNDVSSDPSVPNGDTQNTLAEVPEGFIIDRSIFRGHPTSGQTHCLSVLAKYVTIRESHFKDCKSSSADSQAIWIVNTPGEITAINNYFEGAGEGTLIGGDTPRMNTTGTIAANPAPTVTTASLTALPADYMQKGLGVSMVVGGAKKQVRITDVSGLNLTFEALSAPPDVGSIVDYGNVPVNINFIKNHYFKPLSWRNPIVATPDLSVFSLSASGTGGTLATGTYCYGVTETQIVTEGDEVRSITTAEKCVAVTGPTGSVTINFTRAPLNTWRAYGRLTGAQDRFFTTNGTSVVDDGGAGTAGVPKTADTANYWVVKNSAEVKIGKNILFEGNIFENNWKACSGCGQNGEALQILAINQDGGNDSTELSGVIVRNSIVKGAASLGGVNGNDTDGAFSQRTSNITFSNILAHDLGSQWGGFSPGILLSTGNNPDRKLVKNFTVDHITLIQSDGNGFYFSPGGVMAAKAENLIIQNSLFMRPLSGDTQGEGNASWTFYTSGTPLFQKNAFVKSGAVVYPNESNNVFPSTAEFQAALENYAGGDYDVDQGCGAFTKDCYDNAATDGTDVGANIAAIKVFTDIALSGDDSGGVPPLVITTNTVSNGLLNTAFTYTLTASGGNAPYTNWAIVSGTLPNGLTIGAATGVISGTPTLVGTYNYTVRVTDSLGATTTKAFTQAISFVATRNTRYNYSEGAHFVSTVVPPTTTPTREGDLFYDKTNKVLKLAISDAPNTIWNNVLPSTVISFVAGAPVIHTNAPAGTTEFQDGNPNFRVRANLVNLNQCVMDAYASAAGAAGSDAKVQYSTDGTNWFDSGAVVAVGNTIGVKSGTYAAIPNGMKAEVFLRTALFDGDGAADPAFNNIRVTCKP